MNENIQSSCSRCGTSLSEETTSGLCPRCLMAMNFESRTMPEEEAPKRVTPPTPEEIREKFPQFEVLEYLGRGGMGVVYKARQKALDRLVAIKILAEEWQGDPGFAERFEREAKLLARLNHPNIVTVHDFGEAGGLYYLAMEFVDGVNVRELLGDGKLEAEQALSIVPPICEALQYAHGKGVVHRDIKPENLLLDREGRVKIADFGIAALAGAQGERSGTLPYMAPEQKQGLTDERADIYALGVVLYEMLTGERPSGNMATTSDRAVLDARIDEMVRRAMEKEPDLRYQTAGDFRSAVETLAAGNLPAVRAKPAMGGKLVIAALCGLAALVVLLVAIRSGWIDERRPKTPPELAEAPQAMRKASTEEVITAGLAKPISPWAWQELEKRSLDSADVARIIAGLTEWLNRKEPEGLTRPLNWVDRFIEHLHDEGKIAPDAEIAFVKAVQGEVRLAPLPRLRTGARELDLRGDWRYVWSNPIFGLVMMNELSSVRIDGQEIELPTRSHAFWDSNSFDQNLVLPELDAGPHEIVVEVRSALVSSSDLSGVAPSSPSTDWPPAVDVRTRKAKREFMIYGETDEIVSLTTEAVLNPRNDGGLEIEEIVIQSQGTGVVAALEFDLGGLPVSISFDVEMEVGGELLPCGSMRVSCGADGTIKAIQGKEMRVKIVELEPAVREAKLILRPNAKAIEQDASVAVIWGGQIVFEHVPLKRLDLE